MELGFNKINPIESKKIKFNNINKTNKFDMFNLQTKDELEISSTAKDYSVAMKNLKEIPDVREDVVANYKEQIYSGNYKVSPESIAEKLISNFIG